MIINVNTQATPNFLPKKKSNKWLSVRNIWRLRYRAYALVVVLILAVFLHSGDRNIPDNISIAGLGYVTSVENTLGNKIEKKSDTSVSGKAIEIPKAPPVVETIVINGEKVSFTDKNGKIVTEKLKTYSGLNLGFIFSQPFVDFGTPLQVTPDDLKEFENRVANKEIADDTPKPLDELIPPAKGNSQFRNLLIYDKYKILAPVIYTSFTDVFNNNPDGTINYSSPKDTGDVKSDVQVKLQAGIVHLAYTPQPGELGNSYIIGHSSNYSYIESDYNTVFKPIEQRSQVGEEFVIYDRYGRELKFKVFEVVKIADDDVAKAYERFPDRRVVTLQTSILGIRNGSWAATHRWLTRGELEI